MASGRLAAIDMVGRVNTLIYTAVDPYSFKVTISICNRNNSDVVIRLALVDGVVVDLDNADYIEYDVVIRAGGLIERPGIGMLEDQSLVGYSNKSNVSFTVWA